MAFTAAAASAAEPRLSGPCSASSQVKKWKDLEKPSERGLRAREARGRGSPQASAA
jgi:hypothetical protein